MSSSDLRPMITLPGTRASWLENLFRQELLKADSRETFDEAFACSVSALMQTYQKRHSMWRSTLYLLLFILFMLLSNYEIPLSFPYLSSQSKPGLLDIVLIGSLFAGSMHIFYFTRAHLCEVILKVYCAERHGAAQQELVLLRWGVDALHQMLLLDWKQFTYPWRSLLILATAFPGIMMVIGILVWVIITLWGLAVVTFHPSFGVGTMIALLAALGWLVFAVFSSILVIFVGFRIRNIHRVSRDKVGPGR